MIRYTQHALAQMERRGIQRTDVENAIAAPHEQEVRDGKRSFLRCHPERGKMLRVVMASEESERVITAYFDRRRPCA